MDPLEKRFKEFFDQFYPVIDQKKFWLLPIPAAYEFAKVQNQEHSDGYQGKRLAIIGANAAAGYLAYAQGNSITSSLFTWYLVGGTAFYVLERSIVDNLGGSSQPFPDLDPCGNPIIRNPDGSRSGGGGAC